MRRFRLSQNRCQIGSCHRHESGICGVRFWQQTPSIWLLVLGCLCLAGCQDGRYQVIVVNESSYTLQQVTLWLGDQPHAYPEIAASSRSTGLFEDNRLTETIKVTWLDSQQTLQQKTFQTFDTVPRWYDHGSVYLTFDQQLQPQLTFQADD